MRLQPLRPSVDSSMTEGEGVWFLKSCVSWTCQARQLMWSGTTYTFVVANPMQLCML